MKISVFDELGGPFKNGQKGLKWPKFTIMVIETQFLAGRLNLIKEKQQKISFLKISVFEKFRGLLKRAKWALNEPKVNTFHHRYRMFSR